MRDMHGEGKEGKQEAEPHLHGDGGPRRVQVRQRQQVHQAPDAISIDKALRVGLVEKKHIQKLKQPVALTAVLTLKCVRTIYTTRKRRSRGTRTRLSMVTKYSVSLKLPILSLHCPYTTASACHQRQPPERSEMLRGRTCRHMAFMAGTVVSKKRW